MDVRKKKIELLSPAGDFESLSAALKSGADSVYFGVGDLNMRARAAANFSLADLPKVSARCAEFGARSYVALNSVIYDSDLPKMRRICDAAKKAGISAVLAMDMAAVSYASSIGLPVHLSVQANVSNMGAVRFFAKFADVIVLARELTLRQIRSIVRRIREEDVRGPSGELVRIEVFVHGALCVSIAGKCYMSLAAYNSSANRGDCYQNCRRSYRVVDDETGFELAVDNRYVMSPKDLCTIRVLGKILDAGVSVLKIEGRGRSSCYVAAVTSAYRRAIDLCREGGLTADAAAGLERELEKVFNRGFWHGGYYLGSKAGEWSGISGSRTTRSKTAIGFISNYYRKIKVAELMLNAGNVDSESEILITGPTTGAIAVRPTKLLLDGAEVKTARKGQTVTFPCETKLRRNDKAYLLSGK